MHSRYTAILVLLLSCGVVAGQDTPQIKKTTVKATSAASGKEMYVQYCASCHGKEGKGDGPAAGALKTPPANLSTLTERNNGSFPALKVSQMIQGDEAQIAHGSRDMPIWGQVFHQSENYSTVKLRVANLTDYIKSLQAK
jgi:mono/diheme cytochrome c family protein